MDARASLVKRKREGTISPNYETEIRKANVGKSRPLVKQRKARATACGRKSQLHTEGEEARGAFLKDKEESITR